MKGEVSDTSDKAHDRPRSDLLSNFLPPFFALFLVRAHFQKKRLKIDVISAVLLSVLPHKFGDRRFHIRSALLGEHAGETASLAR
jgi:hypothetical protein